MLLDPYVLRAFRLSQKDYERGMRMNGLPVVATQILIIILLVSVVCIQSIASAQTTYPVYDTTKHVGYTDIQTAIDNASPGDTITVDSGTYNGIIVNTPVSLMGLNTGGGLPVIMGTGSGTGIDITTDNVLVEGFSVTGWSTGIYVVLNNCTVTGNTASNNIGGVDGCGYGIDIDGSYNNVTGNTVNGNIGGPGSSGRPGGFGYGINCGGLYNNIIGNTANYNTGGSGGNGGNGGFGYGICIVSYNNVIGNTANNNYGGPSGPGGENRGCGIGILVGFSYNYVAGNTANNNNGANGMGIYVSGSNNNVTRNVVDNTTGGPGGTGYGIDITGSGNNLAENMVQNNNNGVLTGLHTSGNVLWLNVLQGNAGDAVDIGAGNRWYSTAPLNYVYEGQTYTNYTGNYYSDYSGGGSANGIYLLPWTISGESGEVDRYPLVGPLSYAGDEIIVASPSSQISSGSSGNTGNNISSGNNSVTPTPTPTPTPTINVTPMPTPSQSVSITATSMPAPALASAQTATPTVAPYGNSFTDWWIIAILVVIVVVAGAAYFLIKR
jgi:hypothetical protein